MKVLILTKNLLAETIFQSKLQQLNYEVYCSTCLVNECQRMSLETTQLLSCFDAVILSETIAYQEIVDLILGIRDHVPMIIRKYESDFTKSTEEEQTEHVIDRWIRVNASLEEIRELCQTITPRETEQSSVAVSRKERPEQKKYPLYNFGFSNRESVLLMCLHEHQGQYLSRQELCEKLWREEGVTSSKMTALSSCVRNIKEKVEKNGVKCNPINTAWGRGYQISDDFYHLIQIGT